MRVPAIPEAAARELIVNAFAHADYSQTGSPFRLSLFTDCVRIESPGMLPFGITIEDILTGVSKVRNRVIARVFRELGLIEQWGTGIHQATQACRDSGLEAPTFEEIAPARFRATIWLTPVADPPLDNVDRAIIAALSAAPDGLNTNAVASEVGKSVRTARNRLNRLVHIGLVAVTGKGPFDPGRKFALSRDQ